MKYKTPQEIANSVAVCDMGYATVIPINPTAIKTDKLPILNKKPESVPAIISFLTNLLERNSNGMPIAKMERLDEKNPA